METLQDVFFKQSGAAEVAVVDHAEMAKQVAASRAPSPLVDRRTPASVAHDLHRLESNAAASEADRQEAERDLKRITGAYAKCTAVLAKLRKHPSAPTVHATIAETERKLAAIDDALNNPRTGAKAGLDTKTRIAEDRKRQVKEFLDAKPNIDGAQTNRELLRVDREIQQLIDEAASIDTSVGQPSVGVPMRRAE